MDVLGGLTRYLSDVVDILIISYIIYRLLLLLRGTRAVQLLKGLTVVLAAWVFSSVFQLSTLQWLIENLFSVGVIVLRSEEHTSELQSRENLVCRLLLEKKKKNKRR